MPRFARSRPDPARTESCSGSAERKPEPEPGPERSRNAALDVERLDVPADATPAFLAFDMLGHTVGRAFLTPTLEL